MCVGMERAWSRKVPASNSYHRKITMTQNKSLQLVDGKIPAGQPCPVNQDCPWLVKQCPTENECKTVPYSCAMARLQIAAME